MGHARSIWGLGEILVRFWTQVFFFAFILEVKIDDAIWNNGAESTNFLEKIATVINQA